VTRRVQRRGHGARPLSNNIRSLLADQTGSITERSVYDAVGTLRHAQIQPQTGYLYTGQQFDAATCLYSLRARYYQPGVGRFLSRDTYPVVIDDPRELGRYGYVGNNPIQLYDPTGYLGFEYGEIQRTVNNVTRSAVVFGHRAGAAIAAAKGAFDALDARLLSQQIRAQIALQHGLQYASRVMQNLTVAQTTVIDATGQTKVVVAINGATRSDAATRAITNIINSLRARGVDAFIADGDTHAEVAAYNKALTYTKEIVSIGISNTRGPCGPEKADCAAFFDQLRITVFYLGRLVLEK
jgi:RHS repeat-associated protein